VTYSDQTHGLPRNEGYFENNKIIRRQKCHNEIHRARQAAQRAKEKVDRGFDQNMSLNLKKITTNVPLLTQHLHVNFHKLLQNQLINYQYNG
jgi:hypothetical protein